MSDLYFVACQQGTCSEVDELIGRDPQIIFQRDQEGRTGPLVSAKHANWKVLIHLLTIHHVSPHAVDSLGNGIYHYLVDGTVKSPATLDDLAEIRSELIEIWKNDYFDTLSRLQSHRATMADKRPPTQVLLKKPEDLHKEFFELPKTFIAKYIINRFHVVIDRKNNEEKIPSQYAIDLGDFELAAVYETSTDYHPCRRRMIQGLNDTLIRQVTSYL